MTIAEALAAVEPVEDDFPTLLLTLHQTRYTGTVLLHVVNGVPKVVELPSRQIRLRTVVISRELHA